MNEIASLFAKIGADITDLEAGINRSLSLMDNAGKNIARAGDRLSMAVTLPLAAIGGAAVKAFTDLDQQMRNIQSISKQSDESLENMRQEFIAMSVDLEKTTDSASGLAAGFYDIQSSGFAGADAMEVLENSTKAASAGLTNTAVASKAITAALNAYGKKASESGRMSDLMFRTVDRGVLTFEELAGSISNVIPTAANANISFDVISAAIATLTKQGLSASEATVSLNQVILGIIKPSEALTEVFRDLGYESGSAALEALGFSGVLDLLTDAGYDTTDEMAGLFNNVRALRGVLGLTGQGAQLFVDDLAAMEKSAGATQAAFEIQTKSLAAQFKNVRNQAVEMGLDLARFLLPYLQDGIDIARRLFDGFMDLDDSTKNNIVTFGLLAAAAGPALKIIGGGIQFVSGMTKAIIGLNAVLVATPVFLADVGAGLALIQGGAGVFAVASTGAAGLVAALLPFVAVGAAVAGVLYMIKQRADQMEQGAAAVQDTWGDFFDDLVAKGKTASQVVAEYQAAQDRVKTSIEDAGLVGRLFIRNQEELINAEAQVNQALWQVSATYDEYVSAAQQAGVTSGIFTQAQWDAREGLLAAAEANYSNADSILAAAETYDDYLQQMRSAGLLLMVVSREQYDLNRASGVAEKGLDGVAGSAGDLAAGLMSAQDALSLVRDGLTQAGVTGAEYEQALAAVGLTLGTVTAQQLDQERWVSELTRAYGAGVISLDVYSKYLKQVQDGTWEASQAYESTIPKWTAAAEAARAAAGAYQEVTISQLQMAEALKGATKAQIAQTAIQELTKMYEDGKISFSDYVTAVGETQETFGLVDEKSRALSEGILILTQSLQEGTLPATNFDDALAAVVKDAADGTVNMGTILEKFGVLPATITPATEAVDAFEESMGGLPDATTTAIEEVETAWRAGEWKGLGDDAGTGIAAGITSSTPKIASAAIQAARLALAAAKAELGIESPSKEFAKLGHMASLGMAEGMKDGSASAAARSVAGEMITGAAGGVPHQAPVTSSQSIEVNQFFNDAGAAALGLAQVATWRRNRIAASLAR